MARIIMGALFTIIGLIVMQTDLTLGSIWTVGGNIILWTGVK